MDHDDREYRDMLNEGLKNVEPPDRLHAKVRGSISRNVVHMRHRNTALGTIAIAIVATMVLSSVTPVFGHNGTLPQVITAMAAERQAHKMTEALSTATVEQTSAALLVPEATVQAVADSALSETDSILALVIADRAGKPVGEVIALRTQGLGWGVIMAQLGISGHDISEAVGQAQALTIAGTPSTPSQGNSTSNPPAVSNRNGDKVVVNGEIAGISPVSITVAGKTFAIVADTQTKYHGKAITAAEIFTKRVAGMLYATVQGTQLADTTLRANLVIVQDAPDSTEQGQEEPEQPKTSNEQQIRGKVLLVVPLPPGVPTILRVEGFDHDIVLNAATKVEWAGAGKVTLADIAVSQVVQVHVSLSGGIYTATQVHIETTYVKPNTPSDEGPDQQGNQPASNGQQIRGNVTSVSPTLLQISGFAPGIVLNANTKVEQAGAGKANITSIKVGQTLQVHVVLSGTTYTAQQVHIEDKYVKAAGDSEQPADTSTTTWQGTISNIFIQSGVNSASEQTIGVVVLTASGQQPTIYWILATSVLQGTKANGGHSVLTLVDLKTLQEAAAQTVTIQGKLLADGTVDIVKLTVTTVSTSTTPEPTNPGKGKGSDKPGKN